MHYLIGLITAFAGLLYALHRLQSSGFSAASLVDSLNPFLWYRRWSFSKKYNVNPLYALSDPMDVAAVLLIGTAKCEGVVTQDQKKCLMDIFQGNFHLNNKDASDLMVATAHLLRNEVYIGDNLNKVLERSASKFTAEQIDSVTSLMSQVAGVDGEPNYEQTELINKTRGYFEKLQNKTQKWS